MDKETLIFLWNALGWIYVLWIRPLLPIVFLVFGIFLAIFLAGVYIL